MTTNRNCPISHRRTVLREVQRLAWVSVLLASDGAQAGILDGNLSQSDIANIHRISVVASLGNTLRAFFPGITVFGNRGFDQAVPEWSIDTAATQDVISEIQQQGQFTADSLNTVDLKLPEMGDSPDRTFLTGTDKATLLAQARRQGADTLLVVMPAQNPHSIARPGFGLGGGKAFGKLHECVIASLG